MRQHVEKGVNSCSNDKKTRPCKLRMIVLLKIAYWRQVKVIEIVSTPNFLTSLN